MDNVLGIVNHLTSNYKVKGNEVAIVEILYHYFSDRNYNSVNTDLDIKEIESYFGSISLEYDCLLLGNVYQSLLDASYRHSNGVHYTQKEDIHKIIDYLFYNDVLDRVSNGDSTVCADINSMVFFDPACGCGNILVYIYHLLLDIQSSNKCVSYIKPSNFYGIELDSRSSYIAQLSLSLEYYMTTGEFFECNTIKCGDSLVVDWESVVPKDKLSYIVANPPFLGSSNMNKKLKRVIEDNFYNFDGRDRLDLCCFWYIKAIEFIQNSNIRVSILSSDCVIHGNILYSMFSYIKSRYKIYYDFMYDTFEFKSLETFCCVLGFSSFKGDSIKYYVDSSGCEHKQSMLNIYGLDTGTDILVKYKNNMSQVGVLGKSSDVLDSSVIFSSKELDTLLVNDEWLRKYFNLVVRQDLVCSKSEDFYVFDVDRFLFTNSVDTVSHIRGIYNIVNNEKNLNYKRLNVSKSLFTIPRFILNYDTFLPFRFYRGSFSFYNSQTNFILDCDEEYLAIMLSNVYITFMRMFCSTSFGDVNFNKDFHDCFYIPDIGVGIREELRESFKSISGKIDKYIRSGKTLNDLRKDVPEDLKYLLKNNNDIVMRLYGFIDGCDLRLSLYSLYLNKVMGCDIGEVSN